ncbi:hypothetical protein FKP32DRAFT_1155542 [Trametes sanguinea]|nr:hypothetical protein FKP32DRAFT_1155542 [Trametes sanguinea]
MEFVFESDNNPVSVWTRVDPFLFDQFGAGCVYSIPEEDAGGNPAIGTLGLNFLQGTYTALHYPRRGFGRPYVRMAMQRHSWRRYDDENLPPEST